jgi:HTH-type transcriptional regulator/antitoxin HigA
MNHETQKITGEMNSVRVIKNDTQYAEYLKEIRELLEISPSPGTQTAERLDLLAVVLEKYEEERFLLTSIDPIDAITMRMAELGLEQKDLAKTLGSASRASEILNRKRPLSLDQIRILHNDLKIPADVLLGRSTTQVDLSDDQLKNLPVDEMIKRGWFGSKLDKREDALERFKEFIAKISLGATPVFMRRSIFGGVTDAKRMTTYAWLARVIVKAREVQLKGSRFSQNGFDLDFLKQVAKLSSANTGPKLAQEFLSMKGIVLVIEPELPGMALDGAVIRDDDGTPIIGLTLRYDRLDNFWFTLMHELAHLLKHFGSQSVAFVDDLSNPDVSDPREDEADAIAGECLIPRAIWSRAIAQRSRKKEDIEELASNLCIHPAIVAGRIRKETGNWAILSKLVGQGEVQKHFKD